MAIDDEQARGFRFYLFTTDGASVGVCDHPAALRRGDVVTLPTGGGSWRVLDTLGQVAQVETLTQARREQIIRVSASTEEAARMLAGELGADANAGYTPHGWTVSLASAAELRVKCLIRLAAAARTVVATHPDAELFVLDGDRPVRIPPR